MGKTKEETKKQFNSPIIMGLLWLAIHFSRLGATYYQNDDDVRILYLQVLI